VKELKQVETVVEEDNVQCAESLPDEKED